MTAQNSISTVKSILPELFEDWEVGGYFDESCVLINEPNPGEIIDDVGEVDSHINYSDAPSGLEFPDFLDHSLGLSRSPYDNPLADSIPSSHAGALLSESAFASRNLPVPPADALAFYLPFHYYYPEWWGIYIRVEGVICLASHLRENLMVNLSNKQLWSIAQSYLYYHEAFHHKTECFSYRLEVSSREPMFKTGFENFYSSTVLTDKCLEEALAEAHALTMLKSHLSKHPCKDEIMEVMVSYVAGGPPGYRVGADIFRQKNFKEQRNIFSEESLHACIGGKFSKTPDLWSTATHMYNPITNIKSRVNYILPISSPLVARLSASRFLMSSKVLRKKLRKLVGLERMQGRSGRHPMYETDSGVKFPIPEHPGDMAKGTIQSILNQAGVSMNLREFHALKI